MEKVRIADVFDLQMGKTPSRNNPEYWDDGEYDWVSIRDLGTYEKYVGKTTESITEKALSESKIKPVPPNTLIMSFKLSIGKTAITTATTYTNEAIMAFLDKGLYPINLDYFYHQFSGRDWKAGTNKAVMGATLNKKTLGAMSIYVPDLEVQAEVARVLDLVDSDLRLERLRLSKFDQLIKSQFVEMFGDTEKIVPLGEVCSFKSGKTLPRNSELKTGPVLYAKVGDLNLPGNETTISTSRTYVSREAAGNSMIPAGAVVFPKRGGAIGTNKKRVTGRECCLDLNLMSVIPGPELTTEYLLWYFEMIDLNDIANGSTVPQINNKDLAPLKIAIPSIELQELFSAFVAQVDKSRFAVQKSIEQLELLKAKLMQEYFA